MKIAPCKECVERYTACHGTCQKYAAYKSALDNVRLAKQREWKERDDWNCATRCYRKGVVTEK